MARTSHCKWCDFGHRPKDNGEHWFVKSIVPAKIEIQKCGHYKNGISPMEHAEVENISPAARLDRLHDYLTEAKKDPIGNRLYIEDLNASIELLTPKPKTKKSRFYEANWDQV
jgi:hypothetical protein